MPRRRKPSQISPERLTLLMNPTEPPTPVVLGKGTFGTVYAATLDQVHPVALKTTNPYPHLSTLPVTVQSAHDAHARHKAEAKRQLAREAFALSAARRSPGVVRLYGVCQGGLVLQRLRDRSAPSDIIGKVRLCAEVATAVSGLHRLGISHGDIKLGNVMFSNGVKLIDFGLSGVKDCEDVIGRGSAAYLAPEGWGRVEGLDARIRVDVYALGILIYEVLNGVPWKDADSVAVRVLNGERPRWGAGEDEVKHVFERCCAHDPEKRPTAEWVADELRMIERGLVGPIGPFIMNDRKLRDNIFAAHLKEEDSLKNSLKDCSEMDEPDVEVAARSVNPYLVPTQQGVQQENINVGQVPGHEGEPVNVEHVEQGDGHGNLVVGEDDASSHEHEADPEENDADPEENDAHPEEHDAGQEESSDDRDEHDTDQYEDDAGVDEQDVIRHITEEPLEEEAIVSEKPTVVEDVQEEEEELGQQPDPKSRGRKSSSGYLPEHEVESPSSTTETPTQPPPLPRQTDYPFKRQIESNDMRSLVQVLNSSQHDPHQATLALEAITVLLETPPNPDLFSQSLSTLSSLTSRNTTPRLAKAACLVIHHLATHPTSSTERALRISAAYDILATSLRRHPTDLPVVLTATTAMHALASSSPPLCAILVDQGAPTAALRSLARATRAFKNDLPIASASLQALDVMSRQHSPRLIAEGAVEAIMLAMGSFAHTQIDRLALPTLVTLCHDEEGRRRGVNGVGAVAGIITRATDTRLLFQAYVLLAELAKETAAATIAFSGSPVVEAVLGSLEENVDAEERIVQAGFACLTGMSRLGGDICGTLEIMQVFDLVYNLVNARPRHRGTALGAVVFLDEILRELRNASHSVDMDFPFSMLVQLQERWAEDQVIVKHARSAIRVIRDATGRRGPTEQEPKSSLKSFVKRFSSRKGNSLRVGGSAG